MHASSGCRRWLGSDPALSSSSWNCAFQGMVSTLNLIRYLYRRPLFGRQRSEVGHYLLVSVTIMFFLLFLFAISSSSSSYYHERDEILAYVGMKKPYVIAIARTYFKPDYLMSEFSITGYKSCHKYCEHKKKGRSHMLC